MAQKKTQDEHTQSFQIRCKLENRSIIPIGFSTLIWSIPMDNVLLNKVIGNAKEKRTYTCGEELPPGKVILRSWDVRHSKSSANLVV